MRWIYINRYSGVSVCENGDSVCCAWIFDDIKSCERDELCSCWK